VNSRERTSISLRRASLKRNRPLKIAHVTHTFPPYRGGTGNVVWHLTRELASREHDVHVITADVGGRRVASPGVTVHRLRPLLRIGNAPALPRLVPSLAGFDLIHLHYPFFFGAESAWLAARLFKTPYVVSYHHDVRLNGVLAPVPGIYRRAIGDRVLAQARAVLFSSLDYARSSDAAWITDRPTAGELPFGVETDRFSPANYDAQIRRSFDPDGDRIMALFVASLDSAHYFKGLPVLLRAMTRLVDVPIDLVVVGDGDLRPKYERLAMELGLSNHVHFAGAVDDRTLPRLYATSDFQILPSVTRGEAFGLVLLEAMASGKPVIATDLPGVRALVNATRGGCLVPPGNADALAAVMREFATQPGLRMDSGERGHKAVQMMYTWPAIVDRLEATYSRVLTR
jgi:glycosyltransferase involved in cell wall biosynthesis